jgi:uncharacterized membrane protein
MVSLRPARRRTMRFVTATFLRGLAVILPVGLTLYVLWWIGTTGEQVIGGLLKKLLGVDNYPAGTGLLLGFGVVLTIGLLTRAFLVRRVIALGERILQKMPLVKTIYGPLKDMVALFAQDEKRELGQVVLVRVGDTEIDMLGFVTRESLTGITKDEGDRDRICVYLPMSYQLGGFLVMVPRSRVRSLDMSAEQGLRLAITAGAGADSQ